MRISLGDIGAEIRWRILTPGDFTGAIVSVEAISPHGDIEIVNGTIDNGDILILTDSNTFGAAGPWRLRPRIIVGGSDLRWPQSEILNVIR
jgi:hypothetical protein